MLAALVALLLLVTVPTNVSRASMPGGPSVLVVPTPSPAGAGVRGGAGVIGGTKGPVPSAPAPAPALPHAGTPGYNTSRTLILCNGTVVAGNVLPPNNVAPYALAWDPVDLSMWAVGQGPGVLDEINGTPLKTTRGIAIPSGSIDVAYVPGVSVVYVTGGPSGNLTVVSTLTGAIVATLHVGLNLQDVVYDQSTNYLYVTDQQANQVLVIDPTLETVVTRVTVGTAPVPMAIDPATNMLYVGDTGTNEVTVVNTTSLAIQATVPVGANPSAMTYDAIPQIVGVANLASDNVSLISGSTNKVIANVAVGGGPDGMSSEPSTGTLFVSDGLTNNLTLIGGGSTHPILGSLPMGRSPAGVLYDSTDRELYIANVRSGNLTIVALPTDVVVGDLVTGVNAINDVYDPVNGEIYVSDPRSDRVWAVYASNLTEITSVKVGTEPQGITLDPGTNRIFVADMLSTQYNPNGGVSVIDGSTNTLAATLPAGTQPVGLFDDARTGEVYVENSLSSNVTVINATTLRIVTSIAVGNFPFSGTVDTATGQVFVVNAATSSVSVIDPISHAVLTTFAVQSAPNAATYDPVDKNVYVMNSGTDTVSVVNGTSLTTTTVITVGQSPSFAAVDTANGFVEVSVENLATTSVIDDSSGSVVGQYAVGASPAGIAFDPVSGYFFTSNQDSGTLSVSGLLVSTGFSARPNGLTLGNSTRIDLRVPDGNLPVSYAYTGLPTGCGGGNQSTFVCTPTTAGTYHVSAKFWDSVGKSGSATFQLQVNPALTLSVSTRPAKVTEGARFVLNVSDAGGTQPILRLGLTGLPPSVSCPSPLPGPSAQLSCTTSAPGNFTATVWVTDSGGGNVSASTNLTVDPPMVLGSVGASPSTLGMNGLTNLFVHVFQGTPPYSYFWQGLPLGCSTQNASSIPCRPQASGNMTVKVTVTDHGGGWLNASLQFRVYPPVAISSFAATPSSVEIGSSITYSALAGGGSSALSYSYLGLPSGCTSANLSVITCTPKIEGTFATEVVVTDAAGDRATAWTNATVLPASLVGAGGSDPYLWVAAAIAIVVVGVVVVSLLLRRRLPKQEAGNRSAPAPAGPTGAAPRYPAGSSSEGGQAPQGWPPTPPGPPPSP